MLAENKKKTTIALKKAKTSLEKIIKMTEDEKYCMDTIQQIQAVQGLLRSAQSSLLDNHFHTCFKAAIATKNRKREDEMIAELMRVFGLTNKQ